MADGHQPTSRRAPFWEGWEGGTLGALIAKHCGESGGLLRTAAPPTPELCCRADGDRRHRTGAQPEPMMEKTGEQVYTELLR